MNPNDVPTHPRPAMKSPGYKTTPDESGSARFNGRCLIAGGFNHRRVRGNL